jgi:hypothetical protein
VKTSDPKAVKLLEFLNRLREARIHFSLASHREDAIMVQIAVPGERWEVEFLNDGTVEVERFTSNGQISDQSELDSIFERFADKDNSAEKNDVQS